MMPPNTMVVLVTILSAMVVSVVCAGIQTPDESTLIQQHFSALTNDTGLSSMPPPLLGFPGRKKKKNTPSIQLPLRRSYYSNALLCDVKIGSSYVSLMVDTRATNVFVFDVETVRQNHASLFVAGASDVKYYRPSSSEKKKGKDETSGEMVSVKYPDSSVYTGGTKEVGPVSLPKKGTWKKSVVVNKKFAFQKMGNMNTAATVMRGGGYAGVLGLNALGTDANGGSNFVQTLVERKVIKQPSFSVHVSHWSDMATGRLVFGGIDTKLLATGEEMTYFPVVESTSNPCWAVKFNKLMVGDEVILENFVAEFDTTLSSGIFDPTGELLTKYVNAATKDNIKSGDIIIKDKAVRLDCATLKHVPPLRFVPTTVEEGTYDIQATDMFSPEYTPTRILDLIARDADKDVVELCLSSFFNSYVYQEKGTGGAAGAERTGGEETTAADDPPRIKLGLQFMKEFLTEYKWGGSTSSKKNMKNKKEGGESDEGSQVGIGRPAKGAPWLAVWW